MDERRMFQECRRFFQDRLPPVCLASSEYASLDAGRLNALLILADRVLAACEEQRDQSRVVQVRAHLAKAAESGDGRGHTSDDLLKDIELWLKALLWLVLPKRWRACKEKDETSKDKRAFNLFQVLIELDLLTKEEANRAVEEYQQIDDPVRRQIFYAKEVRNTTTHDTGEVSQEEEVRRLKAAAMALLAPLHKHYDALHAALARLVTAPLVAADESPEIDEFRRLIQAEAGERRRHLESFAGRVEWLKAVRRHLEEDLRPRGGYLLLTAPEGTGKSALSAKVTELLAHSADSLGRHATEVGRLAPWLPGVLLHFGKQSNLPQEIVPLLLAQANAMLLHTVAVPVPTPATDLPAFDELQRSRPLETLRFHSEGGFRVLARRRTRRDGRLEASYNPGEPTGRPPLAVSLMDRYRRALAGRWHWRGWSKNAESAVLVIDAIEEISSGGSRQRSLPAAAPLRV